MNLIVTFYLLLTIEVSKIKIKMTICLLLFKVLKTIKEVGKMNIKELIFYIIKYIDMRIYTKEK